MNNNLQEHCPVNCEPILMALTNEAELATCTELLVLIAFVMVVILLLVGLSQWLIGK